MKLLLSAQVPKEINFPDDNEDAFSARVDIDRVVLSDGASVSFDSKTWSRLICEQLIESGEINDTLIFQLIASYSGRYTPSSLSWSKQAAYFRGSFATLLMVEHSRVSNTLTILGIGDTIAVLLDAGKLLQSFPLTASKDFTQHPELLSTRPEHNAFLRDPEFAAFHSRVWSLEEVKEPVVLCMTDALGRWAWECQEADRPAWKTLCELTEHQQFEQLVLREREAKRMQVDDTTLIQLSLAE